MTKRETTKSRFKIGDEVRYRSRIIDEWKYGIVTKYPNPTMKHHSDENNIWAAWHRKGEKPPKYLTYVPYDRDIIELVKAAPTTFEVGKLYKTSESQDLYEILGVTETHIWYKNIRTGIHVSNPIEYDFSKSLEEYISPPPEEWRALFYRENGKPEVSANYFKTKEEVIRNWKDLNGYMYAIRTDINAKKENN